MIMIIMVMMMMTLHTSLVDTVVSREVGCSPTVGASKASSSSTLGSETNPKLASDDLRRPPAPSSISCSEISLSEHCDEVEFLRVSIWLMDWATRGWTLLRPASDLESLVAPLLKEDSWVTVVAMDMLRRPGCLLSLFRPGGRMEDCWLPEELCASPERDWRGRVPDPAQEPRFPKTLNILTRFSGVKTNIIKIPTPLRALTLLGRYHR